MPVVPLFSGTVSLGPGPQPSLLIPILQSNQGPGLPTPPRLASLHLLPEGFPKCCATPPLQLPDLSSRMKPLCPSLTCSTGLPSLGSLAPQVPHHQAPSLSSPAPTNSIQHLALMRWEAAPQHKAGTKTNSNWKQMGPAEYLTPCQEQPMCWTRQPCPFHRLKKGKSEET